LGSAPPDEDVPSSVVELSHAIVDANRPTSRTERLMMWSVFPQPDELITRLESK
jgi:hypothetical protein